MGGGKETPRQKMISMMYIVLTALLALNVSKQILEAYIAIEENIQLANISESDRGNDKWHAIYEKATDKVEKSEKAIEIFKLAKELDALAAKQIQLLDEAKLKTLIALGEPQILPKKDGNKEIGVIIDTRDVSLEGKNPGLKDANSKDGSPLSSIIPIRMNLRNVKGADKYDEGMRVMGIAAPGTPKDPADGEEFYGLRIWNGMNEYRGKIIEVVCKAATIISKLDADSGKVGKTYTFKDPMLGVKANKTDFSSPVEIHDKLKELGALKSVNPKDATFIAELYASLCKNDVSVDEESGDEFHWIGRTFDHAPGVAVLAALSSLQKEVLKARSEVMIYLQGEIGGSDYSFNKVVGLARSLDPVVAGGQEFFVEIQAAAYDSERDPEIDTKGQGQVVSIKNGVALVKFKAPSSGEMNIEGTVYVKKKTGQKQGLPYSTQVMVAPKSGSLELPEFSLLYRGYGNIIIPSASGAVSTSLSAPGCTVVPTTYNGRKGFKVTPGAGTSVTLSLSGKDREGKAIQYGKWPYKVTNMPNPSIQQTSISKSGGKITVKIEGSPLNVSFKYVSVECDDYTGPGNVVPGSALTKFRAGKKVPVLITVVNSLTGKTITVGNSLKVTN